MKVDFLFVYEIRNRELENICLLKYELEKRGYTIAVLNSWYCIDHNFPRYDAEVVVISACYDKETLKFFTNHAQQFNKTINMQCEQIRTNADEENVNSFYCIKGMDKEVAHISWGERNANHLIYECGITPNNVFLTGHLGLDFLRPELFDYYLGRNKLFKKYYIPNDKKVCLFISSFSYVNLPKTQAQLAVSYGADINSINDFIIQSKNSQATILEWVKEALKRDDICFVYRPHPAEADNKTLRDMEKSYSNFRVIGECSVKQWILACDILYTWFSTSIVEIYASGKSCFILRPYTFANQNDLPIYNGAKMINRQDEFLKSIDDTEEPFPINSELIKQYYYIPDSTASYKLVADACEAVYKDNSYAIEHMQNGVHKNRFIKYCLHQMLYRTQLPNMLGRIPFLKEEKYIKKAIMLKKDNGENERYTRKKQKANYASNREIRQIVNNIKTILENKENR